MSSFTRLPRSSAARPRRRSHIPQDHPSSSLPVLRCTTHEARVRAPPVPTARRLRPGALGAIYTPRTHRRGLVDAPRDNLAQPSRFWDGPCRDRTCDLGIKSSPVNWPLARELVGHQPGALTEGEKPLRYAECVERPRGWPLVVLVVAHPPEGSGWGLKVCALRRLHGPKHVPPPIACQQRGRARVQTALGVHGATCFHGPRYADQTRMVDAEIPFATNDTNVLEWCCNQTPRDAMNHADKTELGSRP